MASNPNHEPAPNLALWQLGFRPFFLFGSLQACLAILVWLLQLRGKAGLPAYFDPIYWHAHEMLFGFTGAIIAGFVLTASQNWVGRRGVHGRPLQLLFAVWLIARVLALVPGAGWFFAFTDNCFWPLLAWLLIPFFRIPTQKYNRVFFLFFALFSLSNLALHAEALGLLHGVSRPALMAALFTILLVIGVIAGRVIPFFTNYVLPEVKITNSPALEACTHALTATFALLAVAAEFSWPCALLGALAALAHLVRWWKWQTSGALRIPILFILHLGYFFLPLGFALKSLAALGYLAPTIATHALTMGALGIIVFGMITRVSLGHTGRPVKASPVMIFSFCTLTAAALVRVVGPWAFPARTAMWWDLAGSLWISSYLLFICLFGKWLLSPRPDGKSG